MNLKKIMAVLVAIMIISGVFAQNEAKTVVNESQKVASSLTSAKVDLTSNWKLSGVINLNTSATNLWNWAAGGNNSATGLAAANMALLYKKDKISWLTTLNTEYGETYMEGMSYDWRKSSDQVQLLSKFGYQITPNWYATVLGSFKSQFTKGYSYGTDDAGAETQTYISNWLSPSYTDLSLGIDWQPNDMLSVYMSPAAGRITTTTDSLLRSNYGVDIDKSLKAQFGAAFKARFTYSKVKNLNVISNLSLFTPYSSDFGNFDVDWDLSVVYKVWKMVTVSFNSNLIYYDSVLIPDAEDHKAPRIQFKTVAGVGFGYSF